MTAIASKKPFVFEDAYPSFNGSQPYQVTNEEPELMRALLDKHVPRTPRARIVSICSGGEVPFFVLLSRASELVAIDHSYLSLASAYWKAVMLRDLGPDAVRALIVAGDYKAMLEHVKLIIPELPPSLKNNINLSGTYATFDSYKFSEMRREWGLMPMPVLRAAYRNLGRLRFVHGDISDAATKGPFDLLYFSNAVEHQDRNWRVPMLANVASTLLKEGGICVTASASPLGPYGVQPYPGYTTYQAPEGLELLECHKGYRTTWFYNIMRRKAPQETQCPSQPSLASPSVSASSSAGSDSPSTQVTSAPSASNTTYAARPNEGT